ncbi:NB-ARC domains-containing protein [Tanacetum coccineum]
MLSCKPVLLVLEDVDDHEQLEVLAGSPTWFCPGSLIIFTGKDKQLLRSHRVDEIHDMDFLDEDQSLELFCSFAFEGKNPSTGFKEVSNKVVKYVQGQHKVAITEAVEVLVKRIFPSRVEMDSLQGLNLSGCLKVNQLPEDLGRIKSLTELHVDRTAIKEVPSFVSSLINLESLSFGGQGRIQPRWWTSITSLVGLLSKQQYPQRSVSLAGIHMLKSLNFSYCNLEQVPESIGGLSCLKELNLEGNNLLKVPESIGGLSCLMELHLSGNNFSSLSGSCRIDIPL